MVCRFLHELFHCSVCIVYSRGSSAPAVSLPSLPHVPPAAGATRITQSPADYGDGATHTQTHNGTWTEPSAAQFRPLNTHTNRRGNMSSPKGMDIDSDADFVYDYHTLRVGGLVFAGVIVFLSIILLAGNKILSCGKSKPKKTEEE
ncbi:unnamed protein product [Pleuronectes platessa]|uniref:FXYD domain-containing ion transport regulator n=1 Tax=Pleuronectes platessa TaxID=8262 RepID=A0A9N7U8P8_PLEPL|nr:unnamed protein product [Pleuronectes platessa]